MGAKIHAKEDQQDRFVASFGLFVILFVGFFLGFLIDGNENLPAPYDRLSSVIGWVYFACWSISFYPQLYLNWKRKSVIGLSLDFEVYNLLGFLCYSIFNCAFYWNHTIQEEYKALNDGHPNAVQVNDVFFALHALIITFLTLIQCAIYERGNQTISSMCKLLTTGSVLVSTVFGVLVSLQPSINSSSLYTGLNLLYLLSYIKLGVSLIKYIPQVYLNWKRQSTEGWTIWNVLLDFTGGFLSILQLMIDSAVTNDWAAITGDPVKFGLGFVSIVFDLIFMLQHYVLYGDQGRKKSEETKLLLPLTVDK